MNRLGASACLRDSASGRLIQTRYVVLRLKAPFIGSLSAPRFCDELSESLLASSYVRECGCGT